MRRGEAGRLTAAGCTPAGIQVQIVWIFNTYPIRFFRFSYSCCISRFVLDLSEIKKKPLYGTMDITSVAVLLHDGLAFGEGEGRISMAARLAKKGTKFPDDGVPNPAGGAQAAAEPTVHYRQTGILPIN